MLAHKKPEQFLDTVLSAMAMGAECHALLDELPVPVYMTDADGMVTYWNRACAEFAGREPQLGQDRWCVTWRLYSACGDDIPHSECPTAEAIREKRAIRGKVVIAMRPDGQRVACTPYPTPIFDPEGNLKGAVNMIVDITSEQVPVLAEQAQRCRRLSQATHDRRASEILDTMAAGYERTAEALTSAERQALD